MNADPNPYPDQDKTARHESISRLRSYAFVHNEYFGKIRCELRSELMKAEGQRQDIVSCLPFFFWVRARIRVSIHKQRHMGRHVEQPLVTSNSVCAR